MNVQISTNIGWHLGHQPGLYVSWRRKSIILKNGFALHVYFVFPPNMNNHKQHTSTNQGLCRKSVSWKTHIVLQNKSACGKPVQAQTGLGDTNSYINGIRTNRYWLLYPIAIHRWWGLLRSAVQKVTAHVEGNQLRGVDLARTQLGPAPSSADVT